MSSKWCSQGGQDKEHRKVDLYDNSLVVVGEGVGEMSDDHLGAYHDLDDGGDGDDDDVMMIYI